MPKIETLNELAHLKKSRFGRPEPRHGLKLLYWFANNCLSFNHYGMFSECDPTSRDFGFHPFNNRYDRNGVQLLDVDSSYYVVGNLNSAGADELPDYVREDYTGLMDDSNMDRIIVSLDDDMFDRVYVTEHDMTRHYNPSATYRISKGLLKIISNLELEDFLRKTGYQGQPVNTVLPSVTPKVNPLKNEDQSLKDSSDSESDVNDETAFTYSYTSQRNSFSDCTIL
ncbi:uncharacterized protein LOC118816870 [Colossoma macropomum]|uniref:uncharacterized protein LOC118816870 n=1 Tax=Colossoma macropomum TaxID=42526 RepID=UPI001864D91E|nr:uncharacterized protein LOC118816870 [Colossoma macropomum]